MLVDAGTEINGRFSFFFVKGLRDWSAFVYHNLHIATVFIGGQTSTSLAFQGLMNFNDHRLGHGMKKADIFCVYCF